MHPARSHHRPRGTDRAVAVAMVGVPLGLVLLLVWIPAISTVVLSFSDWDGIGSLLRIDWIGVQNYRELFTVSPTFVPALVHNGIWLAVMFGLATPFGICLAALIDREVRGGRFYQTALYLPVVLSLALIGFIWQLMYSRDNGFINTVTGASVDWYGDQRYNLFAAIVASSWRHVGYVMLLYLAGLKGVNPALREAARLDGAGEFTTFRRVIFPAMRPINIVVVVITVIESLRAFDIVWVINKGRNGLELLSTLATSNIVGEASRIGFGSAIATIMLIISSAFITVYLRTALTTDRT